MARIAGRREGDGEQARCFREKRARKRRARGSDSEQRVLRREVMVLSSSYAGGGGVIADGAMTATISRGIVWLC